MENIIIKESQYQRLFALNESKMRAWKYWDNIKIVSEKIFAKKDIILASSAWFTYFIGDEFKVKVSNYEIFAQNYPHMKNAGGFMNNSTVVFYIKDWYSLDEIQEIISHELEHGIDYRENDIDKIVNTQQQDIQRMAYKGLLDPQMYNNGVAVKLDSSIRRLLYKYWVNTEMNAFVSRNMLRDYHANIQEDIETLQKISRPNANEYAYVWFNFMGIVLNKKHGNPDIPATPKEIKKHFIRQTYHRIMKYQQTLDKKYRYARMNGINQKNIQYWVYLNAKIMGPYSLDTIQQMINDKKLLSSDYVKEVHSEEWVYAGNDSNIKNMF